MFDSQVARICHAPDADLSPHARICRTANSDLSQHSPAACHCSQTRWWSGVIMSKYKHMCATLYAELGLVFRETSESGFLQGVNIEQGRGWEDRTPS